MGPQPLSQTRSRTQKAKQLQELKNSPIIGRSALVNHLHSLAMRLAPDSKYPRLSVFFSRHVFKWVGNYLKFAFQSRFPFPDYSGAGKPGVYPVAPADGAQEIRVAIVADWGTGTEEAARIAQLMAQTDPDFTIHLGDVYYVGDEPEIRENCLGESANEFQGVLFPHGRLGSFALNGNHEMYANGRPYFTTFLPTLGLKGDSQGQQASFFSLETEHWRILAIDTGYNSVGVPILSQIPLVNKIPVIGGDCHLEKKLLCWLRNEVKPRENRKPTLILSHHQYFTKFKGPDYSKPAQQLAELFSDQEVVWLWGHEHRLAIYDKFRIDKGVPAYGRCVGHGGMPVETSSPVTSKNAPLQLFDVRSRVLDGEAVGINGYVRATIRGAELTLDYRDIDDVQVFLETFTPQVGGGLQRQPTDPGILRKP